MKVIRIVFGLFGAAYLIFILVFGAGSTWLMHDPDAAAGVALGAMAVDGDAGVMENARGFAGGTTTGAPPPNAARSPMPMPRLTSGTRTAGNLIAVLRLTPA
jgi:hypothetical protein